jgi:hypothetical protein
VDPFRLLGRLLLVGGKIAAYLLTGIVQALWYLSHRKTEKIGDVIGWFGRSVTNAVAEAFEK